MKKTGLMRITACCLFVVAAVGMSDVWKDNIVLAKEGIESKHSAESTPTRSLMRVISSHTSRILEAIMDGDHDAVIKESYAVAESSQAIMKNFFPEGGQVGEWFKETGKDPKNAEDVQTAIRASLAMEDGETELPRRAPFWLRLGYDLGGLTIVVALAALGSWIAFGPGERAFTGTGAIIPGSIGGMVGRAMFGFGAIVTWIYVVATVVSRVRKYIGSARV